MCTVGDGKVRFTWKEWAGIFSAMVLAAAAPVTVIMFHVEDNDRHQTTLEKMQTTRLLLQEERELWREALAHERELFRTLLENHVDTVGHEGMQRQWLDHERRIAKIE